MVDTCFARAKAFALELPTRAARSRRDPAGTPLRTTDARGTYSSAKPCTVSAQMTRMSTVIMIVDQIGYAERNLMFSDCAYHGEQDAERACPDLAGEECDAGAGDDQAADDVDPSPRRVVDIDDQSGLPDQEVLVLEHGDEPLDDVERAQQHHHRAGEGDPADPARHLRRLYVLPAWLPGGCGCVPRPCSLRHVRSSRSQIRRRFHTPPARRPAPHPQRVRKPCCPW